jgi:hypothetical protein
MILSSDDQERAGKIIVHAAKNPEFRGHLVKNASEAVDKNSSTLGFGSAGLSKQALDIVAELTDEEIKTLANLNEKVQGKGLTPRIF